MSLAGMGVVALWHDVLPEAKDEFHEWHGREHLPERVGIPGFRRGRRYVAIEGGPEFFTLYEADSPEVLGGQDYLHRLNAPTAWTQRMVPMFRRLARSVARVAVTGGSASGGVLLTLRFAVADAQRQGALEALTGRVLPPLGYRRGICGVHLCLADEAASRAAALPDLAHDAEVAAPSWFVLVEGVSLAGVRDAGDALAEALAPLGARDVDTAIYRLEMTRLKTPWSAG